MCYPRSERYSIFWLHTKLVPHYTHLHRNTHTHLEDSSHTHTPGGLLLPVDIYDVLHQQVPLQAVDAVPVQHHLVAARRAAETAAADDRSGQAAGLTQRVGGLGGEESVFKVEPADQQMCKYRYMHTLPPGRCHWHTCGTGCAGRAGWPRAWRTSPGRRGRSVASPGSPPWLRGRHRAQSCPLGVAWSQERSSSPGGVMTTTSKKAEEAKQAKETLRQGSSSSRALSWRSVFLPSFPEEPPSPQLF